MYLEFAKAIVEVLEDEGVEVELREGYSGRGMYGRMTTGIVIDNPMKIMLAIMNAPEVFFNTNDDGEWIDSVFDVPPCLNFDSMGLKTIVY